jgi:hypothetical protein
MVRMGFREDWMALGIDRDLWDLLFLLIRQTLLLRSLSYSILPINVRRTEL